MKFVDLEYENFETSLKIEERFKKISQSGKYLLGQNLDEFEKKFAEEQGFKFCIGVKNATDALYASFVALNVKNKTVILPQFGAYPTVVAAIQSEAKNIIAAPINENFTLDLSNIDVPKNSILVPVNLFGNESNVKQIHEIAKSTNSVIVEDCAQSTGIPSNIETTIAIHSFYPTKPLGCRGDGGAILTNDENLYKKIKKSRFYGLNEIGEIDCWGFNSRLDEWQAAFLIEKISFYKDMNHKRKKNAEKIDLILRNKKMNNTKNSVYHQYVTLWRNRDKIKSELEKSNIPTMIHYPKMLQDMPFFLDKVNFIKFNQKRISDYILSIPIGPHLVDEDLEIICNKLLELQQDAIEFNEII